jgi:hypothetical protein
MNSIMNNPDYRALCAELADHLQPRVNKEDEEAPYLIRMGGYYSQSQQLIDRARAALSQPEPAPTDEEIEEVAKLIHASMRFAVPDNHYTRDWVERGNSLMQDEARRTARAVLARYGTPAIEPVPVSEQPDPRPENCDKRGRCWWFTPTDGNLGPFRSADWSLYAGCRQKYTHWLPHWALPTPEANS